VAVKLSADESFLAGSSEMAERTRAMDWSGTPVGPPTGWPQSLKTAISICLSSRYPIVVWWGNPAYTMFYNDGYVPILGVTKHPGWLGRSGRECWSEIWPIVGPMLDSVFVTGEATWSEDLLLVMHRNVSREENYFTFSYSPIRDDDGAIGGIFCACYETTGRVVGERRLRTLRDLSRMGVEAKTADRACEVAARTLAENQADIPFALVYLLDDDGRHAKLVATTGLAVGSAAAPHRVDLEERTEPTWPLRRVIDTAGAQLVEHISEKFGSLPGGPWPESPEAALIVPIAAPGQTGPTGFLVSGLSPRRVIDADYRSFLDLVAGHIGTSLANARAYEEERKRAEALAAIDRAKTAFFSNISHEFRTPLTLMMGPLEDALVQSHALRPEDRERLELAHRNSLRLLKLVNTLLDFSRIEAGRIEASYEPVDLAALTAELASVFRSTIERAGMKLIIDCSSLSEAVYVDREMWEKVVLNLISNAFKFTFEGEIEVSLRRADDTVQLTVRDTGTGIPANEIPRLFERFHRVKGARGRSYEGSGIGLALVQELIKLHGGSVCVESEVGRGSRFIVSIPLGKTHLPADRIEAARSLASTGVRNAAYIEEVSRWLPDAPSTASLEDQSSNHLLEYPGSNGVGSVQPARHALHRILLADDNADMREYVQRLLRQSGYEVDAASDGFAAIRTAKQRRPDLVLTDVMMPGLDGFGLMRELRADPKLGGVPIILLSARAGEEARIKGMQAGADDYLIKPFSARELLARVESHLKMVQYRLEATEALRHRTEQFETLLKQAPLGVYLVDADFRIREVNPTARPTFGDIPGGVVGRDFDEIMHIIWEKTYAAEIVRIFRHTLQTGEPYITPERAEFRIDRGITEYYKWRLDRILQPDGRYGVVCYFQDISEQVKARLAAQRLASIVESSDDAIISIDLSGVIVSWNQGAERLFGYSAEGAVGKPITMLIPSDRQDEEPNILDRIRRGERVDHYETLRRRRDGSLVDISLSVSPVRDAGGIVVGASKIARDISLRKQAEATRQLLLGELNHRVKNTLASVQAIAQQTLLTTKDPADFATRFAGRIQSLAGAHSLLVDATWHGADLRMLIADQLSQWAPDESKLTAWGPAVLLAPQVTLHLALMLHELGTNSAKYGALSAREGKVTVSWKVKAGVLQLKWLERGGPAVSAPTRRGFGTTLIEQSAKGEGGEAQMLCEAEGISWEIMLPLSNSNPSQAPSSLLPPERTGSPGRKQDAQLRTNSGPMLAGRHFLVIEDEPLIALDLAGTLEAAGARVAPPVATEAEALRAIERSNFDGALLDGNLQGRPVDEIAAALTRRNIPFVFVTGYGREGLPGAFKHIAVLNKPFNQQLLLETLKGVLRRKDNIVQLKPQVS